MPNLYWKSAASQARNLVDHPFESETELEEYLFANQDILDMFIMGRQIRTGSQEGIIDMIGIDQEHKVCIIELKNQTAAADVLQQVLGYAIWAETNPDSIKNLWLETPNQPEGVEVDWNNMDLRIMVVAPRFAPAVQRLAEKINYEIELLKIQRFKHESDEFILVEQLEQESQPKVGTTRILATYDRNFYETSHGKDAVNQFLNVVDAFETLIASKGWHLITKFNKGYVSFKYGTRSVLGVDWDSTHLWSVFVKVPKSVAESIKIAGWDNTKYSENWKQQHYRSADPDDPDVEALMPIIDAAYKNISGS